MAPRTLLLCTVVLAALAGGQAARRRYAALPRSPQRRFGTPFTGDIHKQSFEEYLASNGVSFDSLFEEPSDLRSKEPAPAGRRVSPSSPRSPVSPYEDSFPPRQPVFRDTAPLPPRRRPPPPPQTFLYGDERPSYEDERPSYADERPSYRDEPLSYGDLTERRRPYSGPGAGYDDLGSAGRSEQPEPPAVRRVVVRRPERARRPVVELLPAPAPAADRSQSLSEPGEYEAPFSDQEKPGSFLPAIDFDQPQAAATPRQDGYTLSIPEKKEKQRLEFQVHGQEGPHSYRFGYDTGSGYNRQFRFEERDGYGNTKGRYGFYDKSGKLQVVNYSASPKGGFHAEGDFGKYPNAGH